MRAAKASTAQLLKRLGHPEVDPGRLVGDLSAAQQQIVSMARALSHDVRLIVMDEPFAGLDIPTRLQLMRYLDGIAAQVVMITHDPGQVRGFDRILWLDGGRLIADGPPDQVLPAFEAQMRDWGDCDDLAHLAS